MRKQTLILTALPNGRTADNRLRLSVLISPRLASDEDGAHPTLAAFPDFTNWAASATGLPLQVVFGNGTSEGAPLPASPDPDAVTPDPAVWSAIFPSSATVDPFGIPNLLNRKIRSFPASNVRQHLQGLYTAMGLSTPTAHPASGALLAASAMGKYASDPTAGDRVRNRLVEGIEAQLTQSKYVPAQDYTPANVGSDLMQVALFYKPRQGFPDVTVQSFDFHQAIGSLGSHPKLLRTLGLILDIVVAAPANLTSQTQVRVEPTNGWHPTYAVAAPNALLAHRTVIVSARTRYQAASFVAAPRTSDPALAGRRLRLGDAKYEVTDVDLDGAALKSLALGTALAQGANPDNQTGTTPKAYALPSLRSEGLVLLEKDKARRLQLSIARQSGLNVAMTPTTATSAAPIFDAEDLVRGYYVDIWDDTAAVWSPLCARHVEYRPDSGPTVVAADEAPVTLAVTETDSGGAQADVFAHEMIAKWSGWSLAVPRPGKQLPPDNGPLVDEGDTSGALAFHLDIVSEAPDRESGRPRLPSLRFGRQYRIRARAADLAGNGDALDQQPNDTNATALTRYSRYEPVAPPVVLAHEDSTSAASVRRLVIRSDDNNPTAGAGTTARHLAPPNVSALLFEQAGALDVDGRISSSFFPMLAARDGARFDSSPLNTKHVDPTVPQSPNRPASYVFPSAYLKVPYLTDPFARGIAFYGLPFGASPTVGGIKIPGGAALIPWNKGTGDDGFPVLLGNRITLSETQSITDAAGYAAAARTNSNGNVELSLLLPKGSVTTVRVSSTLRADASGAPSTDIDRMGQWRWMEKGASGTPLSSADRTKFRSLIAAGLHWMVTPYEEITLVHAVRRPLLAPLWKAESQTFQNANGDEVTLTIGDVGGDRGPGETAVQLSGSVQVSGRSTARMHVLADWSELVDLPEEDGPRVLSFKARPHSFSIDSDNKELYPIATSAGVPLAPSLNPHSFRGGTHELHDHKHRMIRYSLEAVSRFAEEFVETRTTAFGISRILNLTPHKSGIVLGYLHISHATNGTVFVDGVDYEVLGDGGGDGTIRALPSGAIAVGMPVKIRFLAGPITRLSTDDGNAGPTGLAVLNVLSTARPKAPVVEYVVPAYNWQGWKATSTTVKTNKRTGNTMRIWLGRPWYSSGDGEELAVVLPTGTAQPDAQDAAKLHESVSLIGADPIWGSPDWSGHYVDSTGATKAIKGSAATKKVLTPADFPLATRQITNGLFVDGVSSGTAGLAAAVHKVKYDEERQLWYCDIQVKPAADANQPYTPFVQLALARFQVNSLTPTNNPDHADTRLSSIVVAELVQLTPDRTLTMTKGSAAYTMKVTGPSYQSTPPRVDRGHSETTTDEQLTGSRPGPSQMYYQVQVPRVVGGVAMKAADYPETAWVPWDQTPAPKPFTVKSSITTAGVATWQTTLVPPTSRPARLVITEYERMPDGAGGSGVLADGRLLFTATYSF